MENRNNNIEVLVLTVILLLTAFMIGRNRGKGRAEGNATLKPDTVVVRDTVRVAVPEPVLTEVVKYVQLTDTVVRSDTVFVPVIQKVYQSEDYRAWVSGYHAALDSIEVFPRTVYVTKSVPSRRWGVGVTGGYGIGRDGFSPYIGVGVYYRIW